MLAVLAFRVQSPRCTTFRPLIVFRGSEPPPVFVLDSSSPFHSISPLFLCLSLRLCIKGAFGSVPCCLPRCIRQPYGCLYPPHCSQAKSRPHSPLQESPLGGQQPSNQAFPEVVNVGLNIWRLLLFGFTGARDPLWPEKDKISPGQDKPLPLIALIPKSTSFNWL